MKVFNFFLFFLCILSFSCELTDTEVQPTPNPTTGTYIFDDTVEGGGVNAYNSFRNNHYLVTTGTEGGQINIDAKFADATGRVHILNSARVRIEGTNTVIEPELRNIDLAASSTYYVIVTTEENTEVNYNLSIEGLTIANVEKIETTRFDDLNQDWAHGGGYNSYNSFRNRQYKFTVTEDDNYIDIVGFSRNTEIRLHILNSARVRLTGTNTSVYEQINSYKVELAGTYYVTACTNEGDTGEFDISVIGGEGTISDFSEVQALSSCQQGSWVQGGSVNDWQDPDNRRFTFTVSENAFIDVVLISQGTQSRARIYDNSGVYVYGTNTESYNSVIAYELTPGTYTVAANAPENDSGTFEICLHGDISKISALTPM